MGQLFVKVSFEWRYLQRSASLSSDRQEYNSSQTELPVLFMDDQEQDGQVCSSQGTDTWEWCAESPCNGVTLQLQSECEWRPVQKMLFRTLIPSASLRVLSLRHCAWDGECIIPLSFPAKYWEQWMNVFKSKLLLCRVVLLCEVHMFMCAWFTD